MSSVCVLKLGGSVLTGDDALPAALAEIARHLDAGRRVVAVVSAQAGETDALLARAAALAAAPRPPLLAALLATGEARSAAALALAAEASGLPAELLDAGGLALRVDDDGDGDPTPAGLATPQLSQRLERHRLVVVPGFVGVDGDGAPRLLGRGGSDATAIFLAGELAARCVLVKDVDGWYTADPRRHPGAERYRTLSWDDAVGRPTPLVQPQAVRLARRRGTAFEVRGCGGGPGTLVGPRETAVEPRLDTLLVHRPALDGEPAGASSTPIYQTATFDLRAGGRWDYTRSGNPTREVLETQLARLDGADRSLACASGMAAVAAVLRLAPAGSRVVAGADLYGGTLRMLDRLSEPRGLDVELIDLVDPAAVAEALSRPAALVWVETPSNPRLAVTDLPPLARLARRAGALLAVDNSILSPAGQRPLALGADLAVQSATKVLGGHGDLTAGVVSTADPALGERLAAAQNAEGTALAPFEAWLLLRGLETLAVRLRRQVATAERLAGWLASAPGVARLHAAPGSYLLTLDAGTPAAAHRLAASLTLFRQAVSFGGVTSSIDLPCEMSHASVPQRWRHRVALSPSLVRLSIGLEDARDLRADLECGLAAATAAGPGADRALAVGAAP
ncbi:MAG TPA: PLP-dependent transferase [Thermoanaerobaculia bacterium]|nr:PLP-dependent transferase [Thermoanaerobaculia bacterium]